MEAYLGSIPSPDIREGQPDSRIFEAQSDNPFSDFSSATKPLPRLFRTFEECCTGEDGSISHLFFNKIVLYTTQREHITELFNRAFCMALDALAAGRRDSCLRCEDQYTNLACGPKVRLNEYETPVNEIATGMAAALLWGHVEQDLLCECLRLRAERQDVFDRFAQIAHSLAPTEQAETLGAETEDAPFRPWEVCSMREHLRDIDDGFKWRALQSVVEAYKKTGADMYLVWCAVKRRFQHTTDTYAHFIQALMDAGIQFGRNANEIAQQMAQKKRTTNPSDGADPWDWELWQAQGPKAKCSRISRELEETLRYGV
jgi:hypothetical protein